MSKLELFTQNISNVMEVLGVIAIFGNVIIPCTDVLGSSLLNTPLPGSYDLVVFCQLLGIVFVMASSVLKEKHVAVDIFVNALPVRLQGVVNSFVSLLGLGLFSVIGWQAFNYAGSLKAAQEVSGTIGIPFYPFAYILSLACIPVCMVFIINFFLSMKKVLRL